MARIQHEPTTRFIGAPNKTRKAQEARFCYIPIKQDCAPIGAERVGKSKNEKRNIATRRAENTRLRKIEKQARASYNCARFHKLKIDAARAHDELRADSALRAIIPARGALFRELRAIARAMKSGAARRGAEFNRARFSALVEDRRRALFAARVGALVAHRLEHGSPRKPIAKLTRAKARGKIRLVKLQEGDRENVIQNVTALIIARDYVEDTLFNREKPNFRAWKEIYCAARSAIRPLVLTYKGADGIAREYDAQAFIFNDKGTKAFSVMATAIRAEDTKRAALVRALIRAALNSYKKDTSRKKNASYKSALKKIRAIATRAGSADIINSQSNDAQALAACLCGSVKSFADYIKRGLCGRDLELKSFRDLPAIA